MYSNDDVPRAPSSNDNKIEQRKMKKSPKGSLSLILLVLVILFAGTSVFFYKKSSMSPEEAAQAEVKSLVQKVGELTFLPTDETPTIATVSDPDALKDQPFFAGSKKGDKVLIYIGAKKAILYDPIQDKIITITPLNPEALPETTSQVPQSQTYAEQNSQTQ